MHICLFRNLELQPDWSVVSSVVRLADMAYKLNL